MASFHFAVVLHLHDDTVHSLKLSELGFLHGENILKLLQVRLLDGCSESSSADNGCARETDCKRGRVKNCCSCTFSKLKASEVPGKMHITTFSFSLSH